MVESGLRFPPTTPPIRIRARLGKGVFKRVVKDAARAGEEVVEAIHDELNACPRQTGRAARVVSVAGK